MYDYSGRRLVRSQHDARLGGVAAGVARYFDLDPMLVRVLWLVAVPFTAGLALLAYFAMWLLLPAGDVPAGAEGAAGSGLHGNRARQAGVVLVALGILVLLSQLNVFHWFGHLLWPLALLGLGAALLLRNRGY